jgi:TonB family protein
MASGALTAIAEDPPPSATTLSSELKDKLEKFEHYGFDINSVTNQPTTGSTTIVGNTMLRTLPPEARDDGLIYLKLPARGIWKGTEVVQAYDKFSADIEPAKVNNSACYHFILGTFAFGKGDYAGCRDQMSSVLKLSTICIPAFRMRALSAYRLGDLAAAKKDWERADTQFRYSTGTQVTDDWSYTVVSAIQNKWGTLREQRSETNTSQATIIVVITIDEKGNITSTQVTETSGNETYDREAQQACTQASPVEPPPPGLKLPVKMAVSFNLGRL